MRDIQATRILEYCKAHGSITAREAFVELNINSHRKVISDIRKMGYNVRTHDVIGKDGVRHRRYFISKEAVE